MSSDIVYSKTAELPVVHVGITVRVAEFYFEFVPPSEASDVRAGLCLKQAIPGWLAYPSSTRIIDLTPAPEVLFELCSKSNRYKIERARQRDNVETEFVVAPTSERLSEFVEYYDAFAASKGIPMIRHAQLDAMARAGKLVISNARGREGGVLAAHAYYFDQRRARLSHSASLFRLEGDSAERNRIGRTHRLLHWKDIVRFRELGVTSYDLGGWYTGGRDGALLRINSFKEEFGGSVVHEWDVFQPGSVRGRLYLRIRDLVHRVRG
jgi:hypothetical protein